MARRCEAMFLVSFFFCKGVTMNDSKSLMHNVRFTPAELAALRNMADERSCSVGAVVRWAVRRAVLADPPGPKGESRGAPSLSRDPALPLSQSV